MRENHISRIMLYIVNKHCKIIYANILNMNWNWIKMMIRQNLKIRKFLNILRNPWDHPVLWLKYLIKVVMRRILRENLNQRKHVLLKISNILL